MKNPFENQIKAYLKAKQIDPASVTGDKSPSHYISNLEDLCAFTGCKNNVIFKYLKEDVATARNVEVEQRKFHAAVVETNRARVASKEMQWKEKWLDLNIEGVDKVQENIFNEGMDQMAKKIFWDLSEKLKDYPGVVDTIKEVISGGLEARGLKPLEINSEVKDLKPEEKMPPLEKEIPMPPEPEIPEPQKPTTSDDGPEEIQKADAVQ